MNDELKRSIQLMRDLPPFILPSRCMRGVAFFYPLVGVSYSVCYWLLCVGIFDLSPRH